MHEVSIDASSALKMTQRSDARKPVKILLSIYMYCWFHVLSNMRDRDGTAPSWYSSLKMCRSIIRCGVTTAQSWFMGGPVLTWVSQVIWTTRGIPSLLRSCTPLRPTQDGLCQLSGLRYHCSIKWSITCVYDCLVSIPPAVIISSFSNLVCC